MRRELPIREPARPQNHVEFDLSRRFWSEAVSSHSGRVIHFNPYRIDFEQKISKFPLFFDNSDGDIIF